MFFKVCKLCDYTAAPLLRSKIFTLHYTCLYAEVIISVHPCVYSRGRAGLCWAAWGRRSACGHCLRDRAIHTFIYTRVRSYYHMWRRYTYTHRLYLRIVWEMNCTADIVGKSVLRFALSPASHPSEQILLEMPWNKQTRVNKCPGTNTNWWTKYYKPLYK